jgi:hypothetical protein
MVQQQYYSLQALAERDQDKPFSKPVDATPARAPGDGADDDADEKAFLVSLTKAIGDLHAA